MANGTREYMAAGVAFVAESAAHVAQLLHDQEDHKSESTMNSFATGLLATVQWMLSVEANEWEDAEVTNLIDWANVMYLANPSVQKLYHESDPGENNE